ncbi:fungal-specific transcription factor domain-containing protein [Xylaria venustula]|nr:fungal-specific transcription factor domain-containing protein [Xylaria venustula]
MSSPLQKPKRRRVTQACDFCHRRAIKCQKSPADTSCENCKDFSQMCTFERRPRKRGLQVRTGARTADDGWTGDNSLSRTTCKVSKPWASPSVISQATAVDVIELYFEIVYPIFPLFHRPSLLRRVSRGEFMADQLLFISTMAICALVVGRVRDGSVTNPRRDPSLLQSLDADIFYTEAQRQLSTTSEEMDLHIIRSHALLAIAAIQNGRIRDMHRHLGIYHMLVDMYGLHDEANWPVGLGVVEREERRRLFWSIYTLDIFQSVVWGGPIRSREQQANVLYPIEVEDEFLSDAGVSFPSADLSIASWSRDKSTPFFGDTSSRKADCWVFGWNFTTDLYRVLEHALTRFRGNQCRVRRGTFLTDIFRDEATVTATSILDSVAQMYVNLPESFKRTPKMTYDSKGDLFGFQAANITASLQLLRLVLFTADGASIQDRCRVASEVISAFISIPVEYLVAISTPLLHHLGGIGSILGAVLEEQLGENEYNQVRDVMLSMAQLLDNLELVHYGAGVSGQLRTQVLRIDEYMKTERQLASLQQDIVGPDCSLMPQPSRDGSVVNGQINHGIDENWSFTIPSEILSDLNWNFDIGSKPWTGYP